MKWKVAIPASALTVGLLGAVFVWPTSAASSDRIGGSDRYVTSVLISQEAFPEGADTVFLGSGEDFPDALVGGAAGGSQGAPVLLTRTSSLPDVVETELARLDPSVIVILGGETAVSAEVAEAAEGHAATVARVGGANRYETAALIADWAFDPGVPVAYLASGSDYPDAIAGAAAAGFTDGPVLLTKPDVLSEEAAEKLEALEPVLDRRAAAPVAAVRWIHENGRIIPRGGESVCLGQCVLDLRAHDGVLIRARV